MADDFACDYCRQPVQLAHAGGGRKPGVSALFSKDGEASSTMAGLCLPTISPFLGKTIRNVYIWMFFGL